MKFNEIISNRWKILLILPLYIGLFLGFADTASAFSIQADFSSADGSPTLTDGARFRINKIYVNFQDPNTGQTVSGIYDVIFQWDAEALVLKPVEVLGCYNGKLRVHVADSTTGEAIKDARVTANGETMVTDEDGIARFSRLLSDKISVRVEAANYNTNGFEVEIPCNGEQRVSTALLPLATQ